MLILKASKKNFLIALEKAKASNKPIIFPTDTIFGIGAPISEIKANDCIYKIKYRKKDKPFPILIGSLEQLSTLVNNIFDFQYKFIEKLWPGPFTLIFNAKNELNELYKENNKIAVRFPKLTWLTESLKEIDDSITATSANISNYEYKSDFAYIVETFKDFIDIYIYEKKLNIQSSTVIDISNEGNIKFIRNPGLLNLDDQLFK